MYLNNLNDPIYEFGIDFKLKDKVYADCFGVEQSGILIDVDDFLAVVDFGGTYGVMKTPLSSVSPYDLT